MAWLVVLALLLAGGTGLGSWLTRPTGPIAESSSSQLVLQDTSTRFQWSAGWRLEKSASASAGTLHATGRPGASVTIAYNGSYLKVLAPTGRAEGALRITLDGRTTTLSNHSSTYHAHQVIFAAGPAGSHHTLTIQVVGTAGHPFVAIDSIVITGGQTVTPGAISKATAPKPTAAPPADVAAGPAPTPAPAPTLTPAISGQKVVQFGTSGTQAQFLALMKDMTVDVIEMAPGTYRDWHLYFNIDRTARPLTIRPASGTVTFDDRGSSSHEGLLYPGWSGYTSHITFQGPFLVINYTIGQTGLISTAWAADMTFNGFTVRGTTAPSTNGQTAWAVYVSSDGTHRGSNLTFDDWNVDNTGTSPTVNGMQLYHTPQATGVTALRWTVKGGYWGFVGRYDATAVDIESWTISGTKGPSFDSEGPAGIVKNMHASTSGSPVIDRPMVNGGGNSW